MGINAANQVINKAEITRAMVAGLELGTETIIAAGALSVTIPVSFLHTAGAIAVTLANSVEGQFKIIIMSNDGGTATLTPTSFANGTTITFDDVYDLWLGVFHAGSWYTVGTPTATVA